MLLNNNAKEPLNLYINYLIMSLLKVKATPKFESKLYNYNKILKYINIKSKLLFLSLLYYHVYKNTTYDKCHNVFIYDRIDKNQFTNIWFN